MILWQHLCTLLVDLSYLWQEERFVHLSRRLVEVLNVRFFNICERFESYITSLTSLDFLPRICSSLNLSSALSKIARTICVRITEAKQFDMVSLLLPLQQLRHCSLRHTWEMWVRKTTSKKRYNRSSRFESTSWRRRCVQIIESLDCLLREEDFSFPSCWSVSECWTA